MSIRIKDIPVNDRPRERLINVGVNNLSNEELLAIILKTGTKEISAKQLADILLKNINNINELNNITLNELIKIKGIGITKACNILASIELGKRINTKIETLNNIKFNNPSIIYEYYKNKLKDLKQEYFYAIYLDASKRIIKDKLLFIGTLNKSIVHPRELFKEAYLCNACSIICLHNHPSGNVLPSKEDILFTNKIKDIGITFGIDIIDHIIISLDKYYSFYENGDLIN
ncbi:MAG TPA: DNA repair protein RadC [Bacilli bacterium]|nr:DNA repair protein RadC [Bacilli bacterium]